VRIGVAFWDRGKLPLQRRLAHRANSQRMLARNLDVLRQQGRGPVRVASGAGPQNCEVLLRRELEALQVKFQVRKAGLMS
jgi:hypothetical protein